MALSSEQQTALLQMTQAMFNATPGSVYLNALGSQVEAGRTIPAIAQSLAGTTLFLGKDYSSLTTAAGFANALINDLVGDNASAANKTIATDYVVNRMNAGATQGQVIAEVTGILTAIPSSNATWGKAALAYNTRNVDTLLDNLLGDVVNADNKQAASKMILDQMAAGATFGDMVQWAVTTLDSVDHALPVWGDAATLFDNRIEVSNYYSVQKHGSATDLATLKQVLAGVTTSAASVTAAKSQIDELLKTNVPVIDLASLNGSNGFTLVNDLQFENNRSDITEAKSIGDINGDGMDDLIVGSYTSIPTGSNIGDITKQFGTGFIVFGKAGGFAATQTLTSLDGSNGVRLNGLREREGDAAGQSVSSAGDINGDGINDLILGAPFIDLSTSYTGAAYVVFGKKSGWGTMELLNLDGKDGFSITGPRSTGKSVSNIGDFNGDGHDDVIIGSPSGMAEYPNAGSSYIVFGKAGGVGAKLDVSALDGSNGLRLDGVDYFQEFGGNVSGGDVNGDGIGDLLISARNNGMGELDPTTGVAPAPGTVYVVFGKAGGVGATFDVNSLDGSNGFRLSGSGNNQVGISMSNAGDVNGDNFDDIIIGTYDDGAYVVFGKASGFDANIDLHSLNGSNGFKMTGVLGLVSGAGDFNHDGFDDLIIDGGSGTDNYLVYGKSSGFAATLALDQLDGTSGAVLKGDISKVNAAGDVNKDGFDDVILIGGSDFNQAYVVFGGVL